MECVDGMDSSVAPFAVAPTPGVIGSNKPQQSAAYNMILDYWTGAAAAAAAAAATAAAATHYSPYQLHPAAAAVAGHHFYHYHPYYQPAPAVTAPTPSPASIAAHTGDRHPSASAGVPYRGRVKHVPGSSCPAGGSGCSSACRLSLSAARSSLGVAGSGSSTSTTTERHGKGGMPSLMDVNFLVSSHSCRPGEQAAWDDGVSTLYGGGSYTNVGCGGDTGDDTGRQHVAHAHQRNDILEADDCGAGAVYEAPAETHISQLFPEILAQVFVYLPVADRGRAAQVCRGWRDASYNDRRVWRGVHARLQLRRTNPTLFASLQQRAIERVQVLSLRRSIKEVITGVPGLTALNLSGCFNVTDVGLGHAFNQDVPRLTELNLSLCKQITDTTLGRIAQHVKNLRTLDVSGCCDISDMGLLLLTWGLRCLHSLNLRSCRNISDVGVSHVAGVSVQCQGEACGPLEELGLQDCQKVTDLALKHVSEGACCGTLRSLNLSFCASITDQGLKYVSHLRRLEEVNLRSCDNVTDAGIAHLTAPPAPASAPSSPSAAHTTSPLQRLDVSFCDKVGDGALTALSERVPGLRELSLAVCGVTDAGVGRVVSRCRELRMLNLGQCASITDGALSSIATHASRLRSIDLYGCSKVTAQGTAALARLPHLRLLNLHLWHQREPAPHSPAATA